MTTVLTTTRVNVGEHQRLELPVVEVAGVYRLAYTIGMLSGASDSRALAEKYIELRREGMGVEQAMIFVGHHWRMWHLRYQPVG
jgi:hypothetical protein